MNLYMLIKNGEKNQLYHFNFRQEYLPVTSLEDVDAQGVNAKREVRTLLILYVEVVDTVHLQVLGQFQVVQHSFLSGNANIMNLSIASLMFSCAWNIPFCVLGYADVLSF